MTPREAEHLKHCNGFGRWGAGNQWHPYIRRGDVYLTPDGLRAHAPMEWRDATHEQIVAEMDSRNEIPMWFGK